MKVKKVHKKVYGLYLQHRNHILPIITETSTIENKFATSLTRKKDKFNYQHKGYQFMCHYLSTCNCLLAKSFMYNTKVFILLHTETDLLLSRILRTSTALSSITALLKKGTGLTLTHCSSVLVMLRVPIWQNMSL